MSQAVHKKGSSINRLFVLYIAGFFVFASSSPAAGAKIPVKIKSVFSFESTEPVSLNLDCLTRDNTEISVQFESPSKQVIFTAKPLMSCSIRKEAGSGEVSLKMLEGRITDELKSERLRAAQQKLSAQTTHYKIKMTSPAPPKRKPAKNKLTAKR